MTATVSSSEYPIADGDKYIIGAGKPSVAIKKSLYSDYPDVLEFRVKLRVMRVSVRTKKALVAVR